MNRMILVGLFLHCLVWTAFGQKTQTSEPAKKEYKSNFVVVDGKLIWRKVFEDKVSIKDYEKFLKIGGHLENIEYVDSMIVGKIKRFQMNLDDVRKGFWSNDIPMYVGLSDFEANIKVEIKPDKYRVTIYNIKSIDKQTASFNRSITYTDLELYYYKAFSKKKYISDTFITYSEPIFDKNFINMFQYKSIKSDF